MLRRDARSVPEDRRALLAPGPDRLLEVLGGESHVQLGVRLGIHLRVQAPGVEARPQHALRALDADAAEPDDALGQLVALLEELVPRDGARDEGDAPGLAGADGA